MAPVDSIKTLLETLQAPPFWTRSDFYIFIAFDIASLIFAILAFLEAKKAKLAAKEAGTTVKIQTITIELSEISQKLDKLDMNISYDAGRGFINEISRKIRRLLAPFSKDKNYPELTESINKINESFDGVYSALKDVRPASASERNIGDNFSVYYAIEGYLSLINGLVAEIMGLLEKRLS